MVRLNRGSNRLRVTEVTHEGAPAAPINAEQALRRSVMSCFLWSDEFYEDGEEIAERILRLAKSLPVKTVADLAVEVRTAGKLRHVPLLLLTAVAAQGRGTDIVRKTIPKVILRADELAEFLSIYAKVNGVGPDKVKKKLSAGVKEGLATAFQKFNEYSLAKYNQKSANLPIKLRDVMRMCHPKPQNAEQDAMWKRLLADKLETPDTWEVALSSGADKKETFDRLLREEKLGYLAVLRNLRNMTQAGCEFELVKNAILARKGAEWVLPFRYVSAARAVPQLEPTIDTALMATIRELEGLPGKTIILVDVSGSMDVPLSRGKDHKKYFNPKSDQPELTRADAAATLASIWPGDVRVFSFSMDVVEVPPRKGMAGIDAILQSQSHSGTQLGMAVKAMQGLPHDRLIVITDEQSHDPVGKASVDKAYMINVASAKNGVGYGRQMVNVGSEWNPNYQVRESNWVHIDGFSENVLRFIAEFERGLGSSVGRARD